MKAIATLLSTCLFMPMIASASGKFSLEPRINADTGKSSIIAELGINEELAFIGEGYSWQSWVAYGASHTPESEVAQASGSEYYLIRNQLTMDYNPIFISPGIRLSWLEDVDLKKVDVIEPYIRATINLW